MAISKKPSSAARPQVDEVSTTEAASSPQAQVQKSAGEARVYTDKGAYVNTYRASEHDDYKERAERLAAKIRGTVEFV